MSTDEYEAPDPDREVTAKEAAEAHGRALVAITRSGGHSSLVYMLWEQAGYKFGVKGQPTQGQIARLAELVAEFVEKHETTAEEARAEHEALEEAKAECVSAKEATVAHRVAVRRLIRYGLPSETVFELWKKVGFVFTGKTTPTKETLAKFRLAVKAACEEAAESGRKVVDQVDGQPVKQSDPVTTTPRSVQLRGLIDTMREPTRALMRASLVSMEQGRLDAAARVAAEQFSKYPDVVLRAVLMLAVTSAELRLAGSVKITLPEKDSCPATSRFTATVWPRAVMVSFALYRDPARSWRLVTRPMSTHTEEAVSVIAKSIEDHFGRRVMTRDPRRKNPKKEG